MASKLGSLSGALWIMFVLVSLTSATSSTYMGCRCIDVEPPYWPSGIFDIPFAVTMVDESTSATSPTTPSQATIAIITANLTGHLYEAYMKTTGFVTVSAPTLESYASPNATLTYSVVYNKTTLNDDGLLTANNSAFLAQLTAVAAAITSTSFSIDGFSVASDATEQAMSAAIASVEDAFNSTAWICTGLLCPTSSTCFQNGTTNIVSCVNKCSLFTADNTKCTANPTVSGVYVVGTCAYDNYYQPYCEWPPFPSYRKRMLSEIPDKTDNWKTQQGSCGMSVGNVLYNMYDGSQCVSTTFITAMSAGCGGVILIMCIILILIINQQREAMIRVYETERKLKLAEAASDRFKKANPPVAVLIEDKVAFEPRDPIHADVYREEIRLAELRPRPEVIEVKITHKIDEDELITEQF